MCSCMQQRDIGSKESVKTWTFDLIRNLLPTLISWNQITCKVSASVLPIKREECSWATQLVLWSPSLVCVKSHIGLICGESLGDNEFGLKRCWNLFGLLFITIIHFYGFLCNYLPESPSLFNDRISQIKWMFVNMHQFPWETIVKEGKERINMYTSGRLWSAFFMTSRWLRTSEREVTSVTFWM